VPYIRTYFLAFKSKGNWSKKIKFLVLRKISMFLNASDNKFIDERVSNIRSINMNVQMKKDFK